MYVCLVDTSSHAVMTKYFFPGSKNKTQADRSHDNYNIRETSKNRNYMKTIIKFKLAFYYLYIKIYIMKCDF